MLKGEVEMARGYCRQRGKNRWQLEVDLGSYIDPKTGEKKRNRKYKTITAKNQKEAETKLAQFIAELTGGGYFEPEKINFVEFVQKEWLPKCGKERLSHTSLDVYIRLLENRILPAFQYLRLDQIKPKHIVDFLHNLREDGMRLDGKEGPLSDSSIEYHYRVLNNIFNFAVEMQFIKE